MLPKRALADADDNFAALPLSVVRRIDELADQYEAACRSGETPDPRSYVEQFGDASDEARAVLAAHLGAIQSELGSSDRASRGPAAPGVVADSPALSTSTHERPITPSAGDDRTASTPVPPQQIALGEEPLQVGEYLLLERLGSGGMGVVYKALHVRLQRLVAIKFPRFAALLDPHSAARFLREAKLVGQLQHPHIVMALDAGDSRYGPYLVTEFIEGETVESLVRRAGPLPFQTAVRLVAQAASALGFAHSRDIVHRDVKPSNLLIDGEGRLRVLDFGLAKLLADGQRATDSGEASQYTQFGAFLGTVGYAAPEQLRSGQTIDHRADIYSLGCVLYFMLTGEVPHKGTLADRLFARRLSASALRMQGGAVPSRFERVWGQMVASAPQRRFASMADVEREMHNVLAASADGMRMSVLPRRAVLASVSLACLAVGGLALWDMRAAPSDRLRPIPRPEGPPPAPAVAPFATAQAKRHQQDWAEYLGVPVHMVNSAGMPFVLLPPGEFSMGMSDAPLPEPAPPVGNWRYRDPQVVRQEQLPRHRVLLTRPLYFGATEVTNAQFRRFVDAAAYVTDAERSAGWGKEDRGWLKRAGYSWKNMGQRLCEDDHCVINVTWNDAAALCAWLNANNAEYGTCRLPTEAEWEFACRAGSTTHYSFGNDPTELAQHGWFGDNSEGRFRAVGLKRPNPFGIYDMYGNRQEWCLDNYAADFYGASPLENPVCETGDSRRVMRGGAHTDLASFCTSSQRWSQQADNPGAAGIRIVCELKRE